MRTLRILLVEDDAAISALLAEMLDALGHSVCGIETTETGAVNAALAGRPDLMIVDAGLSEGSGIDAVATILRTLAMPHILISGTRLSATRPSQVVLQKPFRSRDLVREIARAVSLAEA